MIDEAVAINGAIINLAVAQEMLTKAAELLGELDPVPTKPVMTLMGMFLTAADVRAELNLLKRVGA